MLKPVKLLATWTLSSWSSVGSLSWNRTPQAWEHLDQTAELTSSDLCSCVGGSCPEKKIIFISTTIFWEMAKTKMIFTVSQIYPFCYKLVQGFRVTCLLTGQYNTKGYDMITDII